MKFVAYDTQAAAAEADWQDRITDPGVVWYHDFRNEDEVNYFRFVSGVGTQLSEGSSGVRWETGDGVTGGACLEVQVLSDGGANRWDRPFSPLVAGATGKSVADPAANGTITLRNRDETDANAYQWFNGYWAHPDAASSQVDGYEFYIQCRVKVSSNRTNAGTPYEGKLIYIDDANGSNQEIVIRSRRDLTFDMYTNFGAAQNSYLHEFQGNNSSGSVNPGTQYSPNPWEYPTDQWFTLLYYCRPGHNTGGSSGPTSGQMSSALEDEDLADTVIKVWIAEAGETRYRKIWDKRNYVINFDPPVPIGWNHFKASAYHNGIATPVIFYHRFDQVIMSKDFIPCPQDGM